MCKDKEEGGLAVRDLALVNNAAKLHICWKFLTSSDSWAVMCRARFLRNGKPRTSHLSSSIWLGIKKFVQVVYDNSTWLIGQGDCV